MSDSPGQSTQGEALSLSSLLRHAVIDGDGQPLGKLSEVVAQLRAGEYPVLTGMIVELGHTRYFVPIGDVQGIDPHAVRLRSTRVNLRAFERRDRELLLKDDVLGNRLIDVSRSALVRAYDVRLLQQGGVWQVTGLDVHKGRWFHFGRHAQHPARDWHSFLLLMDSERASATRSVLRRVTSLKAAQIADIIESATSREKDMLLAHVHEDPELEADVFEELDETKQAELLRARSDEEVAELLGRMRADDAADAVMDLAQERRQPVLNRLPDAQKTKVMALLGYHEATAGGLMEPEFLALSEDRTVEDALGVVRAATMHQPGALTTIHILDGSGTLRGTLSLARAVQSAPGTLLRDAADRHVVVALPGDDIVTVTTRMADFNLLSLPVVDDEQRILGIVTVDDALEAAIPRNWARRRSTG